MLFLYFDAQFQRMFPGHQFHQTDDALDQWRTLGGGGGGEGGRKPPPPIIFIEALVLKSGSTKKFLFQEVEPLLVI